jgi:hypothetical protein
MRLTTALATLSLAAFATAAWGHPGHGAIGPYHHLADVLALGGIAVVFALVLAGRKSGGKDHE